MLRVFPKYLRFLDGEEELVSVKIKKDDKGRSYFEGPDGKRLFTQEHMSFEVGEARKSAGKAVQAENDKLLKELKDLRTSEEEKGNNIEAFTRRITELEEATMTVEQRYDRDSKEWASKTELLEKTRQAEVSSWKSRYEEEKIGTELFAAANKHGAVTYETVAPLLRSRTKMVEIVDPKTKAVNGYKPIVDFDVVEDGKSIRKEMSIDEAMSAMRADIPRYGHLFKKDVEGGAGAATLYGGSADGAGGSTGSPKGMSQAAYNDWAKSNLDGAQEI